MVTPVEQRGFAKPNLSQGRTQLEVPMHDRSTKDKPFDDYITRNQSRRAFLGKLGVGALVVAFGGGLYRLVGSDVERQARAQKRPDGRPRLPPGQRLIQSLRPMGGVPGDPSPSNFRLRVYGEVESEFTFTFAELLAMPQTEQLSDVHCVTAWSLFDVRIKGVRLAEIARRARVKPSARHVIFEAAAGYTSNVPLAEALAPDVLLAHQLDGKPLPMPHGPPVRALVPSLYFWKSAKWLTGVRFVKRDESGFWETRGYHNHGDPWTEERYG
jgi:DMSO/TMAO reductase YedYZ molybdopterin-dependent catalytic subunit